MTLTQPQQLGCGLVQATFVTSSGILTKAWSVISSRDERIVTREGNGLVWKVYEEQDLMVVAFEVQPGFDLKPDLVSSSHLMEDNFPHFEFLCNNKFPVFSVNRSAVLLFRKYLEGLDELKARINSSTRLIVAGHGLGGSVASLFTILLLDSIWLRKNRPLCITFGSPLIGDKNLQQAISRSYKWNSCFLHVVSLKDPLPRLFVANHSSSLTPQIIVYMPFGTFLFCSDVNSVCFENPDIILELLMARHPIHVQDQGFQSVDYLNLVKNLNQKAICKDLTTLAENTTHQQSNSKLESSITLQLRALGLTPHMQQQQQSIDIKTLEKMEKHEKIRERSVVSNAFKKLLRMKIHMADLEWYKKYSKSRQIGYYDSYKNMTLASDDVDVCNYVIFLNKNWEKMVSEAEINPQKGDAAFRKRWIYAGTSYRRMVEPLVIADYYKEGKKDYVTRNRPKHFVLLEEWFRNEMTKAKTSDMEDNCELSFEENWDFITSVVDNRIRSCQGLMVVGESEDNSPINLTSDDENEEAISSTMCFSNRSPIYQRLLSNKELNVMEENEENLNTSGKNNDNKHSSFDARVDMSLISSKESVKEENIKKCESPIDEALVSRQSSMSVANVKDLDEMINREKRNVERLLTIDSCFWAHVEEALLLCKELEVIKEKEKTSQKLDEFEEYVYGSLKNYELKAIKEKEETSQKSVEFEEYIYGLLKNYELKKAIKEKEKEEMKKLVEFEEYVYGLLTNYEVSPEIFLKESSYMRWWNLYKAIKGTSYNSALASFMNDVRNYHQYALGNYDFF